MTRPLAFGWTAVRRQACFPHGSLQPYHAPEAKPHHGDRGDAGQHHENPAKPRRSPHPGPGRRTLQSAGPSPGTPASGRLGWFRRERIAHNHAGAGPAAAPQAPNFATSQHEGGHPGQPHEPTAAGGDAAGAQECSTEENAYSVRPPAHAPGSGYRPMRISPCWRPQVPRRLHPPVHDHASGWPRLPAGAQARYRPAGRPYTRQPDQPTAGSGDAASTVRG